MNDDSLPRGERALAVCRSTMLGEPHCGEILSENHIVHGEDETGIVAELAERSGEVRVASVENDGADGEPVLRIGISSAARGS